METIRYDTVAKHLHTFIEEKFHVSDIALVELELSFIEQFHVYLKTKQTLQPLSICRYLDCLIHVVNIAFIDGHMPRNPFALYHYSAPMPERTFLNEEELLKLQTTPLRKSSHEFNRDMFLFSCFTGICHADMCALTWKQIVQDNAGAWWVYGNRVKTGTPYVVKLLSIPLSILEKYRGAGGQEKVFSMARLPTMNRFMQKIIAACGIEKHITFHCARHTFATTICLKNDMSLETLSKILGHKNIATTQIYAKITAPMIDFAIDRVESKIEGKYAG